MITIRPSAERGRSERGWGTGSVIRPGEVQRMTAGTGVTHCR